MPGQSNPGKFSFLPNIQTKLVADASEITGARLSFSYDIEIAINGTPENPRESLQAYLRGPGDILSIINTQIARTEPESGLRGFEPNYFPFVEFVDADFPWRYSLDIGQKAKKQTWLVLIALKPDEFEFVDQGNLSLSAINVLSINQSLPNLDQSWAFAHVQVNMSEDGAGNVPADPLTALKNDPARGFSRLFCYRKLEALTNYHLFLVPAYKAGLLAGLGESGDQDSSPAWDASSTEGITLPIYYQSRFTTDAQEDVEALARRLRPLKADDPEGAGAPKEISAANPDYYEYSKPGAKFELQGALKQTGKDPQVFNTDNNLAKLIKITLEEVIHGERKGSDDEDPLVAFPPYGFRFQQESSLDIQEAKQDKWFDRINLDLQMRQAAALGAETVRENQEFFAKLCWDQYEEIVEANRKLDRLKVAETLASHINQKHFNKLPSDIALILSEPLQPYVFTNQNISISNTLRNSGSPVTYASRNSRRISAKRTNPNTVILNHQIPILILPGDSTPSFKKADLELASRKKTFFSNTGPATRYGKERKKLFTPEASVQKKIPRLLSGTPKSFSSKNLVSAIEKTVVSLPAVKAYFSIVGRTEIESKKISPIYRCPTIPLALAENLSDISKDAILSGVSKLPDNTVTMFEENRQFIEAFMVGANHAINDELRWREFPTDMQGTVFRRFWKRGGADQKGYDINQIHLWNKKLGKNPAPEDTDQKANVVVVIRGDIIRKLGAPIAVINKSLEQEQQYVMGEGEDHEPIFMGKLGRDIIYYGFDLALSEIKQDPEHFNFLIFEPMGRLRFGLDVGTSQIRIERQKYEEMALPFPLVEIGKSFKDIRSKQPTKPAPATLKKWVDLSWSHMRLFPSGYVRFNRIIQKPLSETLDLWGNARTSASLARSFWQMPIAVALPMTRIL